MGRLQEHFFSNAGDASPFLGPSPQLSGGDSASPSPLLLPVPPGGKRSSRSRHVIVRLICSPFAAVFRTTCSPRASSKSNEGDGEGDDDQESGAGDEQGQAARRRPRLEELLKMESASSAPELKKPTELVPDVDASWKESAIVVFGFGDENDDDTSRTTSEEEEDDEAAPLAVSEDDQLEHTVPEQQMAIVPVGLDVSQPAAGFGSAGAGGGAALMNVKRLVVLLEAMRARSMALKVKGSSSSYWRLSGRPGPGGRAADKADQLFYDRPIPLGRRCRVHESSPYQ